MKRLTITLAGSLSLLFITGCQTDKNVEEIVSGIKVITQPVPVIPPRYNSVYLQNWNKEEREWYRHFPQGTNNFPYKWFISLEKPIGTGFRAMGRKMNAKDFVLLTARKPELLDKLVVGEKLNKTLDENSHRKGLLSLHTKRSQLFIDNDYISGFGFLPVKEASEYNPDALPVGLTRFDNYVDPMVKGAEKETVFGFGCAACHTSRIDYKDKSVFIDGGPSQANLPLMMEKLYISLGETYLFPRRFARFANRVYGHRASKEETKALRKKVKEFIVKTVKSVVGASGTTSTNAGFYRLDALDAIGNNVFSVELNAPENMWSTDAPVSYPMLWTVPWLAWAEYPGVVRSPMVRNIGETLGVNAPVNLTSDDPSMLFKSSSQVDELYRVETLLMEGVLPWDIRKAPKVDPWKYAMKHKKLPGLNAPRWPEEILGKIDKEKAEKGAKLYKELCQGCHLPPIGSEELFARNKKGELKYWTKKNKWGKQFLNTRNIDIFEIGTDPTEMMNFYQRTANTYNLTVQGTPLEALSKAEQNGVKKLGIALSAADGLKVVTEAVGNKWYADHGITDQKTIDRLNGYRENIVLMSPPTYRARPLDGIWATGPFLHNGSVWSLYELLSPVEERSKAFITGLKEFDPKNVGFVSPRTQAEIALYTGKGFSLFSTIDSKGKPITGNSNAGHEFKGDGSTYGNGVIGRGLSEEERWQLVEYLKTL